MLHDLPIMFLGQGPLLDPFFSIIVVIIQVYDEFQLKKSFHRTENLPKRAEEKEYIFQLI